MQRCWEQRRHEQARMPRVPLQALIWSKDRNLYELYTHDQLAQRFRPGDEEQWLKWLAVQTSVAFHGRTGRLNLHNEARTRRERYWYAYHSTGQRTLKRYLGKTANVTLARLEQAAQELTSEQSPAPPASVQPLRAPFAQPHGASPHASRKVEQRVVVLSTKLSHPRLPAALVVRERLLRQLDAAFAHQLTVLSASAGWGKTTLLSVWATRRPHPVAWVSLDALDNDLTRFWVSVI